MKVGVVVVAYNPEPEVAANLRALDDHASLMVIDNSTTASESLRAAPS